MPRLGAGREVVERRAAAVVGAVQVRRDEIVEPVGLGVAAVRAAEPAAGDERMDRPELLGRFGERLLDLAAIADVARGDMRGLLERRGRRLEPLRDPGRAASATRRHGRVAGRSPGRSPCLPPSPRCASPVMSSPDGRNLRESRARTDLDPRACRSIDSSLRRARGAGGRSLAGRRYAEAEGQPAKWTKATRLGELHGPLLDVEHVAISAICCGVRLK